MNMATFERIRVGIIGMGVGSLYAASLKSIRPYYPEFPEVDLVCVATHDQESAITAKRHFGFERHTTDYLQLLQSEDINVVIITTPNHLHYEMLMAALETDKAIYMDKPLAHNLSHARELRAKAQELDRDAQMVFEFRYCPALIYAHQLIQQGRLGDLYAYRTQYYRSSYINPEKPLRWKGQLSQSGGGVLMDYAPHLIDQALWLVGMPDRVSAMKKTFIQSRPEAKGSENWIPVETEDHIIVLTDGPDGCLGTIEAGRVIQGAVNEMEVEVYGSQGSLKWHLMDPNYLYVAGSGMEMSEPGWHRIPTVQNYPDSTLANKDLPIGMMRFHIACLADFLRRSIEGDHYDPGLVQGLAVQAVIDAAYRATETTIWEEVPEVA
jgi:predicted dehydrogenase